MEQEIAKAPLIESLKGERLELNDRIDKIEAIERDEKLWADVPRSHQRLIRAQKFAMLAYSQCLDERIGTLDDNEADGYQFDGDGNPMN